jgi:hypothetical protein
VTLRELTMPMALEIAENLCERHRCEVLRRYESLAAWALSRLELPGIAWAYLTDRTMMVGGVVSSGETGVLWLAGREGWEPYARHAIRVCRSIIQTNVYERYTCEAQAGDAVVKRWVESFGFRRIKERNGYVVYGVAP